MRGSRILLGTGLALAALTTVAGCASTITVSDTPDASITGKAFDEAPCDAYSSRSLVRVVQPALTAAGWPKVVEVTTAKMPDTRLSANVQRCEYTLAIAHPAEYGDQSLTIFVYDEMSNGRRLMDACEAHATSQPGKTRSLEAGQPGDESCLDENGQWRFRVGDRYASVAVNVPARRLGDGEIVSPSSTGTFVAAQDVTTRAAVSRAIAEDLAHRLR